MKAVLHDAYAADYDHQIEEYGCHIAEVLFGLCYEAIRPGQCVLDAGIGSGLSAALFAKAGLEIHGFDFSPEMLGICRSKRFTADLKQHDIQQIPWPYPPNSYDHLICCGVLHFVSDLELIFSEGRRVLRHCGLFAFTTRVTTALIAFQQKYEQILNGEFEIYSHSSSYVEKMLAQYSFEQMKIQRCLVGEEIFQIWITRKQ